jgi:hypothetical protein
MLCYDFRTLQRIVRHNHYRIFDMEPIQNVSQLIGNQGTNARCCDEPMTRGKLKMIVTGPEILAELGIKAGIVNNVLVIFYRGCWLMVSARQFRSFDFPGHSCVEARLIARSEGEIIINRSIIVPIGNASADFT